MDIGICFSRSAPCPSPPLAALAAAAPAANPAAKPKPAKARPSMPKNFVQPKSVAVVQRRETSGSFPVVGGDIVHLRILKIV